MKLEFVNTREIIRIKYLKVKNISHIKQMEDGRQKKGKYPPPLDQLNK